MAAHGALIASKSSAPPAVGFLASVRSVALHVSRLDDVEADLVARGERVTGDDRTVLYEFSVSGGGRVLVNGRATIVFDIARPISRDAAT
jgi:predicted hotdog family 3-hydroxylacyl-ACP dehydratase